jgi:hypothetical protein
MLSHAVRSRRRGFPVWGKRRYFRGLGKQRRKGAQRRYFRGLGPVAQVFDAQTGVSWTQTGSFKAPVSAPVFPISVSDTLRLVRNCKRPVEFPAIWRHGGKRGQQKFTGVCQDSRCCGRFSGKMEIAIPTRRAQRRRSFDTVCLSFAPARSRLHLRGNWRIMLSYPCGCRGVE